MGVEIGHAFRAGMKKNTNAWGGLPLALGAGDGFEFNTESLKSNVAMIMNEGIFGGAYRRPGNPGNKTPGGDIEFDFYYQDAGHRLVAGTFGQDVVTALGGGAHRHDLTLLSKHLGIFFTLAFFGEEGVREAGHVKVTGLKMRWQEGDQGRGKLTASLAAFDTNLNVGQADDDFVVVSVTAANGPLTITPAALAGFNPSPLFITKDAGVTAVTAAIVAKDRKGRVYTKTITETDFVSDVWTDSEYVKAVISITLSGVSGTGNIKVGVTNGVNNAANAAAVTTEAARDVSLYSEMELLINDQAGAALGGASTDEQFPSAVEIGIEHTVDSRVTTQFGDRIEEPVTGGGGWPRVTFGMNFSAFTDRNRRHVVDQASKERLKAKVTLIGTPVGASSTPHSITLWLNELQLAEGDPNVGGPGVLAYDLSGEAHSAVAVPTGFPAGVVQPVFLQIVNGLATPII